MLKDEERIAEVKRRIAKKEQQQRLRRRRIVSAVCIAACFAVIVGVSFAMPGIIGRIEPSTSSGFETAATILGGSTALGYMVIGLLAFILGACVTILCFRIHQLRLWSVTAVASACCRRISRVGTSSCARRCPARRRRYWASCCVI